MKTYAVTVTREGEWWVFTVPDLDTAGQAHTLEDVPYEARGVISAWENIPFDEVDVSVKIE